MAKTIILHADEIRPLLAGQPVTVRREVKPQPPTDCVLGETLRPWTYDPDGKDRSAALFWDVTGRDMWAVSVGDVGRVLRVRETWFLGCLDFEGIGRGYVVQYSDGAQRQAAFDGHISALADPYSKYNEGWHSPATMPAWASRMTVTVKAVTVEQVGGKWMWCYEIEREG
jgi:hypothetical protein